MRMVQAKRGWGHQVGPVIGMGFLAGIATVLVMNYASNLPLGPGGSPYGNGALGWLLLLPASLVVGEGFCLWQRAWLAALALPVAIVLGYLFASLG
jgi:hypothetical protein